MGDVVELKTKEQHECSDPHCKTYTITEYELNVLKESNRDAIILADELMAVVEMTLWERIFKWKW